MFAESHQINLRIVGFIEQSTEKLRAVLNAQTRKIVDQRGEGSKSKGEPVGQFDQTRSVSSNFGHQSQIYSEDCHLNGLSSRLLVAGGGCE